MAWCVHVSARVIQVVLQWLAACLQIAVPLIGYWGSRFYCLVGRPATIRFESKLLNAVLPFRFFGVEAILIQGMDFFKPLVFLYELKV